MKLKKIFMIVPILVLLILPEMALYNAPQKLDQ
jgi:hypothetical protein